jgi:hypothetical protein
MKLAAIFVFFGWLKRMVAIFLRYSLAILKIDENLLKGLRVQSPFDA